MKSILFAALIVIAFFVYKDRSKRTPAVAEVTSNSDLQCLFTRPLVIGASVSAGYGTQNGDPGSVLSKLINPDAVITNKAISGETSRAILSGFQFSDPYPSVILAFDLFFWDAVKNDCGSSFEEGTRKFFGEIHDLGIPVIVGKIPVSVKFPAGLRLASSRPCTKIVNTLIAELCTEANNCIVFDPKDCISAMGKPVSAQGVSYFRDQLHTSDAGNKFCAELFREQAPLSSLTCTQD